MEKVTCEFLDSAVRNSPVEDEEEAEMDEDEDEDELSISTCISGDSSCVSSLSCSGRFRLTKFFFVRLANVFEVGESSDL